MNDLVEDANKWVNVMKKDKADIIVAFVHSGEKPKKPRHPGNRIQELAQQVNDIDAIVAGHNHEQIEQHDYKNKSGKKERIQGVDNYGKLMCELEFLDDKTKEISL